MDTKWTDEIEADFDEWRKTHGLDDGIDWDKPEQGGAGEDEETLLG